MLYVTDNLGVGIFLLNTLSLWVKLHKVPSRSLSLPEIKKTLNLDGYVYMFPDHNSYLYQFIKMGIILTITAIPFRGYFLHSNKLSNTLFSFKREEVT